ncbi:hypothetical protein B0H11DRAFT_2053730 [Mycena galericulata]|nr:hypothetical protein B0H11DRAFT_2053730 [Mycena galericulata]
MLNYSMLTVLAAVIATPLVGAVSSQSYTWRNVKIGGGIVFNPSEQGLAYVRTDIGGAYKLNAANDTWTPLLDFANDTTWNYWGVAALATDPVQTNRLYLACGGYTNSFDPNNGNILISTDYGSTFTPSPLPFKVGGNMPGRGQSDPFRFRLAVDPNSNGILYFGAGAGKGLWKSTNFGATWAQVTNFPSVANQGSDNIFVSTNAGATWSAVAGQNNTYLPHKGVLSPVEEVLYISYSNGAGPYDGTLGSVFKYNLTSSVWTDITPVTGSNLYFGFGGVAVDLKTPGTIMVAALNSWWPDGQIFRSTDSGATWSPLWSWLSYPTLEKFYSYSDTLAPWLGPDYVDTTLGDLQIGWMMEALVIDPFDSNHWLYGTGATIYGGHNRKSTWDTTHNVSISSLADGIEETSVQALISPPTGASLISALGDIQGFVHTSLTQAPSVSFTNPTWSTTADLDFAGNDPSSIVRIGTGDSTSGLQVALSNDGGISWSQDYGAAENVTASGDTVLWRTSGNGVLVSQYTNPFVAVPSLPSTAAIASDKLNDTIFYGAASNSFYLSTDGGKTFAKKSTLGSSASPVKVIVNPQVSGDVWVSTDTGLFHSTNFGSSFEAIPGITEAWAIALGAPLTATSYPAIFAAANIGGVGYFRSDDGGVNWVKINDVTHGFGSAASNCISGDPRIYGRVYVGTNGRGIFYGDVLGPAPPPSTTLSGTSSSTSTVKSTTSSSSSTTKSTTSVSSTTKSTTTTTSSTSSSPPTSTGAAGAYGQCGGIGWTGATTCPSGM